MTVSLNAEDVLGARNANLKIMAAMARCLDRPEQLANAFATDHSHREQYLNLTSLRRVKQNGSFHEQALRYVLEAVEDHLRRTANEKKTPGSEDDTRSGVLFISFAIANDTTRQLQETSHTRHDFGLAAPIFASTSPDASRQRSNPSITDLVIKHFLAEKEGAEDYVCFGVCVINDSGELKHSDHKEIHSILVMQHGRFDCKPGPHVRHFKRWLTDLTTEAALAAYKGHVTDFYLQGFEHLHENCSDIKYLLSANSIFRALDGSEDPKKRAAAQVVLGLREKCDPYRIYHLLQIILCGLPMAWNAISGIENKRQELTRHRDMFEALRQPLDKIGVAVRSLQEESQLLSAVLKSPVDGLFAAHVLLAEFFEDGKQIRVNRSLSIPASHSGTFHEDRETNNKMAWLVIRMISARILGIEIRFEESIGANLELALQAAGLQLENFLIGKEDAFGKIRAALRFLIVGRDPNPELNLLKPVDMKAINTSEALGRIKAALFTPFKVDAKEWPAAALCLLIFQLTGYGKVTDRLVDHSDKDQKPLEAWPIWSVPSFWSPLHYAPFLEFILKVCKQAEARSNTLALAKCAVTGYIGKLPDGNINDELCIELFFETKKRASATFLEDRTGEPISEVIRNLKVAISGAISRGLTSSDNVQGNLWRPFVELAARIGGVTGASQSSWREQEERHKKTNDVNSRVLVVENQSAKRQFELRVSDTILLRWAPLKQERKQ